MSGKFSIIILKNPTMRWIKLVISLEKMDWTEPHR